MKSKYYATYWLVIIAYLIITTVVYMVSVSLGHNGITMGLFGLADDGFMYWREANNVAQGLPWLRTSIYTLIIGNILSITGIYNPYIIRLFNIFGFIILLYYSMNLIDVLNKEKIYKTNQNKYATKIYLLFCYLLFISLIMNVNHSIYRDIWIYALSVASIVYIIKIVYFKKYYFIPALIFFLWLLYEFRDYSMFSIIGSFLAFYGYSIISKHNKTTFVFILLMLMIIIYYTFFMEFRLPIINMNLRSALQFRDTVAIGSSQMGITLDQPNVLLFFVLYLHSFIGNMIGPLPWHISGWGTMLVFFTETIPMVYILIYIFNNRSMLTKLHKYLLINAFVWFMLISMFNDNLGTATRLRIPGWLLILIIFATEKGDKINKMLPFFFGFGFDHKLCK